MKQFWKQLFGKRRAQKAIREVAKELETRPAEEFFHHIAPPYSGTAATEEEASVTTQYSLVVKKMKNAVEENKDTRRAAKRLMDTIGVSPELKKSSSQNT